MTEKTEHNLSDVFAAHFSFSYDSYKDTQLHIVTYFNAFQKIHIAVELIGHGDKKSSDVLTGFAYMNRCFMQHTQILKKKKKIEKLNRYEVMTLLCSPSKIRNHQEILRIQYAKETFCSKRLKK